MFIQTRKTIEQYFPLSSGYDRGWIKKNSMSVNVLYNLETLCKTMTFFPGLKILDLGCGKAITSIFLAMEFDARVWAVDPYVSAAANYRHIAEMNCQDKVFPMNLKAGRIRFPYQFFDAIIAVNSYSYFGNNESFIPFISRFLKPSGQLGIIDIGLDKEIRRKPDFIKQYNTERWHYMHSLEWWVKKWERPGMLNVVNAETPEFHNEILINEIVRKSGKIKEIDKFEQAMADDQVKRLKYFILSAEKPKTLDI